MAQEFVAWKACLKVSFKHLSLKGKGSSGCLDEVVVCARENIKNDLPLSPDLQRDPQVCLSSESGSHLSGFTGVESVPLRFDSWAKPYILCGHFCDA
jgi:hypothetical protein